MNTEKCFSVKKNVYKMAKHGLATTSLNQKTVHGEETYWLSGKVKVPGVAVSKEDQAWQSSKTRKDLSLLISLKKVQL